MVAQTGRLITHKKKKCREKLHFAAIQLQFYTECKENPIGYIRFPYAFICVHVQQSLCVCVCLCFLCPFCLALSFWSVALACYHSRLLWGPLGVFEYEYAPLQFGQHIGSCEINAVNSIRPGNRGICHRPVRQTL